MTTWTIGGRTFRFGRRPDVIWQIAAGVFVVLLVAGSAVAFTRAGTGRDSSDQSTGAPTASGSAQLEDKTAADGGSAVASSGGTAAAASAPTAPIAVPPLGSKIVRTADLQLRVRGSFTAAVDRATAVAGSLGGFVGSSSTSSLARGRSSAELTLRIPVAQFDEAQRQLRDLGTLESISSGSRDVGGQLVDLDARLRVARAEEEALTSLLAKSGDIGQILQVRDRLAAVRTEIEQLDGEQVALRDQVAMSTIHVSLHERGAPVRHHRAGGRDAASISDSARTALHAAEAVIGGMVIVAGALSPVLALFVLGLLGFWLVAGRRRGAVHQ